MKIGGLYQLKKYYWLLYPSRDIATASLAPAAAGRPDAAAVPNWVKYWSEQFNCNVSYISSNSLFVLLEQDGKYYKVLSTNGELGWIIYPKNEAWTKGCIEEVKENS